jgi:eukaryotic-like serine/threonine-protein kinase
MQESPKRRSVRTTLPAGTRVGRYTIVDRIGAGGMAELFLARQDGPRGFAKPIALKLLHAHIGEDPEFVAMFEREARVAAALVHPHVVQVLDIGVAEDEHFLALEFVHGRDLRRILVAQRGPLPLGPALRVVTDVAKALHYVHTRCDPHGRPLDLVHRDVSPANVLVGFAGSVKLADFGIAKAADQTAHTRTGTLKGKFGYMAPEQCLQQGVDARSDLFALGVVLYEATTGRRAFGGSQTFSIMNRVLAGDYAPPITVVPDYPPALADIVARMLAVDPACRPASAQAVVDELEAFVRDASLDAREEALAAHVSALFDHPAEPSLVTPDAPSTSAVIVTIPDDAPTISTRKRPRLSRMAALATIGVVGIVVGGVGGWRMARGEDPEAPASVAEPATEQAAATASAPATPTVVRVDPAPAPPAAAPVVQRSSEPRRSTPKRTRRRTDDSRRRAPDDDDALSEMFPKAMQ